MSCLNQGKLFCSRPVYIIGMRYLLFIQCMISYLSFLSGFMIIILYARLFQEICDHVSPQYSVFCCSVYLFTIYLCLYDLFFVCGGWVAVQSKPSTRLRAVSLLIRLSSLRPVCAKFSTPFFIIFTKMSLLSHYWTKGKKKVAKVMETVKELLNIVNNFVNKNIREANSLILLQAYNNYGKKKSRRPGNI